MSFLYLQWLKINENNKDLKEFKTIPITEFNSGDWRSVINVNYQDNAIAILSSLRSSQKEIRKAILRPEIPGEYQINF